MHKILLFIIFSLALLTIFTEIGRAEVSLGIWPAQIEINASFKTTTTEVYLFNPGSKDIKIKVEFYCENCERDFKLFNQRMGSITNEPKIDIIPSTLILKQNTSLFNPEKIRVIVHNPFWMKKQFKTSVFGKDIYIPFYGLIFDKDKFDGKIIVTTLDTKTALSITSEVDVNFYGINKLFFLISLLLIVFLVILAVQEHYKRVASKLK